jgi:hypothetical protein
VAGQVYSTRFIASGAADFAGTYTVPAGFRAIIRDLVAYCPAPVSGEYVYMSSTTLGFAFWISTFAGDNNSAQFQGRTVLEPGENLTTGGNCPAGCGVIVSGYLLTLP